MTQEELTEVINLHVMWLNANVKGRKANLRGADLVGANLGGANNIFLFNKQGGRTCYAVVHDTCLMISAGCFWGTLDEFIAKATAENAGYEAQIIYLQALSKQIYDSK